MVKQEKQVLSKSKFVCSSPRKLNLVARLIRGLSVDRALDCLAFCRKSAAIDTLKILKSAISNAENNYGLDVDLLKVKEAYVGKAVTMRRWHARAKGRGSPIKKKYSKLTIIVCEAKS